LLQQAYAQEVIIVNQTTPCFLNFTAGVDMWENCGADEDTIAFMLLPFEWITGGYFTLIIVSVILLAIYLKYHKVIFAVGAGAVLIPYVFQIFPDSWLSFAMIMVALGLAATVLWMIRDQIR
jgi:hypothetical protein